MYDLQFVSFKDAHLQIIDGDRGLHYPKKTEFQTSGYCVFLNTGNVTKIGFDFSSIDYITEEKDSLLRKGKLQRKDIVLTTRGTVGNVAFYDDAVSYQNIRINSGMVILRVNTDYIEPKYLYYFLKSELFFTQVSNNDSGSAQPQLPISSLNFIKIPYVPFDCQKKIASVLSALDAKIELNNRINAELEAMAKTLYDYWFVQFDFPDSNGKPYKTSGGKMVWNEQLKREIPEGWEVTKMADWIDSDKSGDWGKEEPEGNFTKKVTCIRGADINGLNGLAELKPPVRYILEKNSSKVLDSHNLIVEISGGSPVQSTGRIAFITDATIKRFENPLICSNFCKPISIKNKKLLYNFVYYWNSLYDAGVFFGYEGKTSGIKNLLFDSFVNSYYTVVPEDSIVSKFYSIMENINEKKQTALAENQQLSSLRDWLLPMLMNGQVTVGAKERAVYKAKEELGMAAEPGGGNE